MTPSTSAPRCPAAHPADPRGCEGQPNAVRIVDQTGADIQACLLHGAVLLASIHRGRVHPLHGPQGSAIAVYTRARDLPPFDFLTGPGVGHVATTHKAAVSPYASAPTPAGRNVSASSRRLDGGVFRLRGNA